MAVNRKDPKLLEQAELAMVMGQETVAAPRLAEEFGVTERTVWRYYKAVRERWATEEAERRPQRREEFRAMIMQNLRVAWAVANPMAGAATLRVLAKLDGLEAPSEIKITGGLDIKAMSPMERQAEIERLLAIRAVALDGRRTTPLLAKSNGKGNGTKH